MCPLSFNVTILVTKSREGGVWATLSGKREDLWEGGRKEAREGMCEGQKGRREMNDGRMNR